MRQAPSRAARGASLAARGAALDGGRSAPLLVVALVLLSCLVAQPAGSGTAAGAAPEGQGQVVARIAALAGGPAGADSPIAPGDERPFQPFDLALVPPASTAPAGSAAYAPDGTFRKPFAVLPSPARLADQVVTYRVRAGDTLAKIAARFGLKMSSLYWANDLTDKDTIQIGDVLAIPPIDGVLYTVKEGDTIESIAAAFHADAALVVAYNGLAGDVVVIGQTIMVPDGRGRPILSAAVASTGGPGPTIMTSTKPPTPASGSRPSSCTGWKDLMAPPNAIRVLRTSGPASGSVQIVDFQTYVGDVMAMEWPVYYPAAALQAGAIAVKQYGWYYTMHYRGGVSARGACYDVVDNANDQLFRPEARSAYAVHKAAIAATWTMSVRRSLSGVPGQFILTGYRPGTVATCGAEQDGFHLYELGVFDCARQGRTLEEIEGIYYGPTLQLVIGKP
ncbi:MAG: LysM peptidoglycan-binding domain-containing protein [Candidatus Limnocylindrales bacterium]